MNVMDDDRHAGTPGRKAAQDSRLAAVGVDDVRFLLAEDIFQPSQRQPVFQRVNRPDEFGHASEDFGRSGELRLQRTFGSGGGSGKQINFEAGFLTQAKDGSHGVFLGPADDQPGDDVRDAHRRVSG